MTGNLIFAPKYRAYNWAQWIGSCYLSKNTYTVNERSLMNHVRSLRESRRAKEKKENNDNDMYPMVWLGFSPLLLLSEEEIGGDRRR